MKRGDRLRITVAGHELDAKVVVASGRSALVEFDAVIEIPAVGGAFFACGALPIMCGEEGTPDAERWVEALGRTEVAIRPAPEGDA